MTKKATRGEFNSFVKGLITEASPLNFPEQAASDIENFELNKDGTLNRRLGLGPEPVYATKPTTFTGTSAALNNQIFTYVWDQPGGVKDKKFLIVCSGGFEFDVFDMAPDSIISGGFIGKVSLLAGIFDNPNPQFATIDGYLVVTNGSDGPQLVIYNPIDNSITVEYYNLLTRDIWGVSDPETDNNPTKRVTEKRNSHLYNLYNQGWNAPRLVDFAYDSPEEGFKIANGKYPADSEKIWTGIRYVADTPTNPKEKLFYGAFNELVGVDNSVSRGSFIIDLVQRGPSRSTAITNNAANVSGIDRGVSFTSYEGSYERSAYGPRCSAQYAGRIWYAGFGPTLEGDARSPDLSRFVAFTQLIKNKTDFAKCYQEGDPTSRESNDVIDTDGGLVRISDIGTIIRMVVLNNSLLVFADNGVWSITGGSDYGFSATNYKVDRVSEFGALGPDSVVTEGNSIFYWAENGIFGITFDQFGKLTSKNLTSTTIQKYYEQIPTRNRGRARGVYDTVTNKVRWLYEDDEVFSSSSKSKELILDLVLGAFSVNSIRNFSNTAVVDLFITPAFSTELSSDDVLVNGTSVTVNTEDTIISSIERTSSLQSVKYLLLRYVVGQIYYSIGWYNDPTFRDWAIIDGNGFDAKAYLVTGALTAGDSSLHKQVPVLVFHMKRTENQINSSFELENQSGCFVRSMWDWANSSNSNKWGPLFQAYRYRRGFVPQAGPGPYDYGFDLITTRNKLRGRGRALSLYVESEPQKDCQIIGWSLSLNGNSVA